tara:strand:- start:188 stop:799 length:612 start_codon:yes stop_codon:yes gene_type:complete
VTDDSVVEEAPINIIMAPPEPSGEVARMIGLYGNINEEKGAEIAYRLFMLAESGKFQDDETGEVLYDPLKFVICTPGGTSSDMFAIYDAMRIVRKNCDIETLGLGEVMSGGVLLLAAGTKGERRIGENCRFMLHGISAGSQGTMHNLENEIKEFRWIQNQYIKALSKETKMTKKEIKELLDRKIDVYFDAKQALKYGIADEII